MSYKTAAHQVLIQSLVNGGTTISRDNHLPTTGYVVGGVVPSLHYPMYAIDVEIIEGFIGNYIDTTGYIGAWIDNTDNSMYLDVVEYVDELAYAMKLADERGELAIYDVVNDEVLDVNQYFTSDN